LDVLVSEDYLPSSFFINEGSGERNTLMREREEIFHAVSNQVVVNAYLRLAVVGEDDRVYDGTSDGQLRG
jgi:hypothetical protein